MYTYIYIHMFINESCDIGRDRWCLCGQVRRLELRVQPLGLHIETALVSEAGSKSW